MFSYLEYDICYESDSNINDISYRYQKIAWDDKQNIRNKKKYGKRKVCNIVG